jgi:predicted lipoprotein with Yx(FWY)xxD motif
MRPSRLLLPFAAAGLLMLAACGSDSNSSSSATTAAPAATTAAPAATTAAPAATTAAPATTEASGDEGPETIKVTTTSLGDVLSDGEGHVVYLFKKDSPGKSVCEGDCAANWPAVTTTGAPVAATGADASKLGTFTRSDGSTQVTYGGAPIYYFAGDASAGQTNGQGVGGVWFAVKADGSAAG